MNKRHIQNILFLTGLVFVLAITNINPHTFLTGWDNLHPEFNFPLNIFRALFSSWQEYQGLGLAGGMGHAAELPRQLVLWIASFVLPLNLLRYTYHLLCVLFGAIGVYFLLSSFVLKNYTHRFMGGLIGAVLYVCNLATLQMFYVPFEPFSHHFAVLPWLLFATLLYFYQQTRKTLLFLIVINIVAIPQGFVATYFLVTSMLLGILYILHLIRKRTIVPVLMAGIIFFCTNAFWLLPNMYFLAFKSNVNVHAKINEMATEDNFLKNKKYGDLENSVILKNFWFDNVETNPDGTITYQMQEWIPHFNNPLIVYLGYSIFLITIGGIIIAIRKKSIALLFLPILLLAFTVLANDAPVFSQLATLFYKVPLFSQIFRFPFTKFAIVTSLCFALFYALCATNVLHSLGRKKGTPLFFFLFLLLPIIFMYPIFFGQFFQDKNKVAIPKAYFDTFDFFAKEEPTARVANFPQYTYWGWSLYRWGYRGSGLWWYGMNQPVVDRAFDVWGKENENYYHEVSYAVYSGNQALFKSVLDKYQIQWILVDESIISFSSQKPIYFNKLQEMLTSSQNVSPAGVFDSIHIYKVAHPEKEFVTNVALYESVPNILPGTTWNNNDKAHSDYATYREDASKRADVYYPFRSLFTNKTQEEREFTVVDKGDYFSFQTTLPKNMAGATLIVPLISKDIAELQKDEVSSPQLFLDNELIPFRLSGASTPDVATLSGSLSIPLPYIRTGLFEIHVPKLAGQYSFDTDTLDYAAITPIACNPFSKGDHDVTKTVENNHKVLHLTSKNSSNCVDFELSNVLHRFGYIVSVDSTYKTGKSLLFLVRNKNSQREEIETYLPKTPSLQTSYFVIPPMERDSAGYSIHFDNISTGRVVSENTLGHMTVYPIPYDLLTSIKLVTSKDIVAASNATTQIETVSHPNPSLYVIDLKKNPTNNTTLVLSQSFDNGWNAYEVHKAKFKVQNYLNILFPFLFGERVTQHVLVDNWANGWTLNPSTSLKATNATTIVMVFLPQYLQYIGTVLFVIPFLLLFKRK